MKKLVLALVALFSVASSVFAASAPKGATPVTLTIGNQVFKAWLNDSAPAKSLIARLPLEVTLNDSDNDFCGGNVPLKWSASDVKHGYKNGELAFWTPANNFVIFVHGEERSAGVGDLVSLGMIVEPLEKLRALSGRITVKIALAKPAPMRVKITAAGSTLTAVLDDNPASRALWEMLPLELPMMDLYGREMCYRFPTALPTAATRSDGYEVGDLAYWPPRHSFVILYRQNGEEFERVHLGHIDKGVELFRRTGDCTVTFERE